MKAHLFLVICLLPATAGAGTFSGGIGFEREGHAGGLADASNVIKLIAGWENSGERFAGRRPSVDIDAELRWESNPEKYDSDRNPVSWEVEAGLVYPAPTLYPTLTLGPSLGLAWM
ncbi:MAG: hypothetical protein HUJ31_03185, partial [Pseudomonadales bacterium]|nr:hypothetical protein [Pseudomonadales bacterium]